VQIPRAKHANQSGAFLSIRETRRPRIDPHFNFLYAKRMAKKAAVKGRADLPVSQDAQQRIPTTRRKSSSLLDTHVVYCGDKRVAYEATNHGAINQDQREKCPPSTRPSPIRLRCATARQAGEGESFPVPLKIRATGFAGHSSAKQKPDGLGLRWQAQRDTAFARNQTSFSSIAPP